VTLTSSTLFGNTATDRGAGIYALSGAVTLRSSIVAGKPDSGSNPYLLTGTTLTLTNSLLGNNSGTNLTPTGLTPDANGNLIGSAASPIDPLLGPLQDNGGPTQTMALRFGSPAIDRGSNPLNLATDQRGPGFPRVFGVQPDMGAFESRYLVVTTATDKLDPGFDPANLSLREVVREANTSPAPDTITFAANLIGVPIRLTLGELAITESLTIQGLGAAGTCTASGTCIDAQGHSRIFAVSEAAGAVTLDGLTLTGGRAPAAEGGGAIGFGAHATLTVQDSTLSGNTSSGAGGAIAANYGSVTVNNSTLSGNSTTGAMGDGGAIFTLYGYVRVTNSTISGNSTQGAGASGGGIFAGQGANVTNSTISGNSTQGPNANGGGLATGVGLISPSITSLDNSTVTGNFTQGPGADGGGIVAAHSLQMRSSIVARNHDTGNSHPDLSAQNNSFVITNSLIGDNTGTGLPPTGLDANGHLIPDANGNFIDSGAQPVDPMLGPLRDNGGPTETHALLPLSPAIDHGSNPLNLAYDQRGAPHARVVGPQADMGAFEAQLLKLHVTSARDTLAAVPDPNNLSLRDALALANANPGPDTITFDPSLSGVPIQLSLGQLLITDPVTIQGLDAAHTVIDAQQHSRIFDITATAGDVTLDGLTLTGGRTTALAEYGGAIRSMSGGTLVIINSTVTGNSTLAFNAVGGGIAAVHGGLMLTGSTVAGNSTQGLDALGGGMWVAEGPVTVTNSTVADNSIPGEGGGIFAFAGAVTVTNGTVAGNSAHADGGIFANLGAVTLRGSIVADNHDSGSNPDLHPGKGPLTVTNSLIGTNQGTSLLATGIAADPSGNLIGSAAGPIDPLLGPLQDNGGPTPTLALLPGSPAIGRGSNPLELATDQRGPGFPRSVGGAVDMGAFQLQVSQPPPPAPTTPLPPPPPPPMTPPDPIGVVLVSQKQGRTRRLFVQVRYANGRAPRLILSPFRKPRYRSIAAVLADLDADGVADTVVFTARLGRRKVKRVIPL
jgi:hypothetical protein